METLILILKLAFSMGISVSVQAPSEYGYYDCNAVYDKPYTIVICQPYADEAVLHIHVDN